MRSAVAGLCALLSSVAVPALACPDCAVGKQARAQVLETFWPSLTPLLIVAVILAALIAALRRWRGRLTAAGVCLGIGLGGFLDGIVLHQLLQWHNMLSSRVPPDDLVSMKFNMVWDAVFHLLTWTLTALGVAWLFQEGRRPGFNVPGRAFVGAAILGWGLFNVVEGLVDHQIAGIHHVRPGAGQLAWDLGFLLFGAAQILIGWTLMRSLPSPRARSEHAPLDGR